MTKLKIESNYGGDDWTSTIVNGDILPEPIYVAQEGMSVALELADVDRLIEARAAILAAQRAWQEAQPLPEEPGLYVHPKFAEDGANPAGAMILRLYGGEWNRLSSSYQWIDPAEVRRLRNQWGGLARLEVSVIL